MQPIRALVLAAVAAICLCRCALSGEPSLAPPSPCSPAAASSTDGQAGTAPILISARSIRVATPLGKIDSLLGSLAGRHATEANISVHGDKIEIVRRGADSSPEIECFGDVTVKGDDFFLQAERVLKRGNTLVFEGTSGRPVRILCHTGKAQVHLTSMEVDFDLPSGRMALTTAKTLETTGSVPKTRGR